MKLQRVIAGVVVVMGLGGVAYFADERAPLGVRMADAAGAFLGSLSAEQRAKCTYDFDDKERTNWIFVPMQDKEKRPTRKGLRIEEMNEDQHKAVLNLLKTGTSAKGFEQATAIMSLEVILHEVEKNGANVRSPGWYFLTVFGKPSRTGKWGWRIEGHHLSLNFTIVDGQISSATPAFFGSNPAEVRSGDRKGQRILKDVEDSARELFASFDDAQKKAALQPKHFGELAQHVPREKVGEPLGLSVTGMNEKQRGLLEQLLKAYTARMPDPIGAAQWQGLQEAGLDKVYFAWTGSIKSGEGHSYRIQGPTFLVQFLNVQEDSEKNPANHIHSAWRALPSDFGLN
jgi:hypothetical protein